MYIDYDTHDDTRYVYLILWLLFVNKMQSNIHKNLNAI